MSQTLNDSLVIYKYLPPVPTHPTARGGDSSPNPSPQGSSGPRRSGVDWSGPCLVVQRQDLPFPTEEGGPLRLDEERRIRDTTFRGYGGQAWSPQEGHRRPSRTGTTDSGVQTDPRQGVSLPPPPSPSLRPTPFREKGCYRHGSFGRRPRDSAPSRPTSKRPEDPTTWTGTEVLPGDTYRP